MDNLFSQGAIPSDVLGVFYAPLTKVGETNGEITFGGIDESKWGSHSFNLTRLSMFV